MGRCYDNWERLVEAVMRREQIRSLSLADSRSPSVRSTDSDFSWSSSSQHDYSFFTTIPSPLHTDPAKLRLAQSVKEGKHSGKEKVPNKRRNALWKGLSIFSGFSSKKDNGREERELQWAKAQRILHEPEPEQILALFSKQNHEEVSLTAETVKRRAELARLQQLHTLKGHIESLAKARGVDLDSSVHHYYTI